MTYPQSIDKLDLLNVQFLNLERLMISKKNLVIKPGPPSGKPGVFGIHCAKSTMYRCCDYMAQLHFAD